MTNRRQFLTSTGLVSAWRTLGMAVPYARFIPIGLMPAALADQPELLATLGKDALTVLNDKPINLETPAHLLDDAITPATRLFVRNNGLPPKISQPPDDWAVTVQGESCVSPQTFTVAQLKQRFEPVTLQLQLECGGNGRAEFRPRASGNQWSTGAVACPQWTGVRLADVLRECGVADNAVYVAYRGADSHLSGHKKTSPISRGVTIAKAMEPETLLAYEMNGAAIPDIHGAPLRMVAGGWPGSVSGKWVTEILVRDRVHDGAKMTGSSYRVPCNPVAPGAQVADDDMCIVESMPVKSLITYPKSGLQIKRGDKLTIRGHAWAGDRKVSALDVSVDFGASWQRATLDAPANRLAWQRFHVGFTFDAPGYYEVWARATDDAGLSQPMLVPGWNPKGYLNNACHRIAVQVV